MENDDLLRMMRVMDITRDDFAYRLGISTRTLDRYIVGTVPKRIDLAARWVFLKEMGREYS